MLLTLMQNLGMFTPGVIPPTPIPTVGGFGSAHYKEETEQDSLQIEKQKRIREDNAEWNIFIMCLARFRNMN